MIRNCLDEPVFWVIMLTFEDDFTAVRMQHVCE